ncbi:pepsin F-like [Artibeus jamaicensis]|uniref:pepsin F-like n=1 Tax=Artibeus jamaicensis TaxID=9417 RepID=UPI00235A690C|nr:pepsin F-like [Artibeus jamaicensis]
MRESLREKDLLKDYLEEHPYSQAYRFIQKKPGITYESMRNFLDPGPGSCITSAPSVLERPLRSSRSSSTRAPLTCGCPPSTASAVPVVSAPSPVSALHPTPRLWRAGPQALSVPAVRHTVFNPKKSSTFQGTNRSFSLHYGSGSMTGFLGYDTIKIGTLVDRSQAFGLSKTEVSKILEYGAFDGILGLSYPSMALTGTTPVFDNLWTQGVLSQNLFAFYLSSNEKKGSMVMFGGVDSSYYKGELKWVPVSKQGFWQITMDSISMKGKVIACEGGCEAIADTGTSLLTGPDYDIFDILKTINARMTNTGEYVVSCNAINTLPDIVFTINGFKYPVPARAYIRKGLFNTCYSNFDETLSHSTLWILGDVFLRLYFTVFDRANNRIGLAPAVA